MAKFRRQKQKHSNSLNHFGLWKHSCVSLTSFMIQRSRGGRGGEGGVGEWAVRWDSGNQGVSHLKSKVSISLT